MNPHPKPLSQRERGFSARRTLRLTSRLAIAILISLPVSAAEPDYSAWTELLGRYYAPAKGFDYGGLKARDSPALFALRERLGRVDASTLTRDQQLAYWINVYNVNTVATIVENYPLKSIRDLSTDPIIRLNVFKKPRIPSGSRTLSLDEVEHEIIRPQFKDPRIHFAINCAAKSCPPMRPEAITGAQLDAQLDEQTRQFLNGPLGAEIRQNGNRVTVKVTKIMDWFGDDFDEWGGGKLAFLQRYLSADKLHLLPPGARVRITYHVYDWELNDWRR